MTSSVSWWLATARWTRKLASAAIAAVCCVSCINEYPADTEDLFRTRSVDLALQISLLEDADKEGETLPEVEKMHDLRVIITRMENGKEYVEYNRYIDFGTQREYRYGYLRDNRLVFRVTAPEKKHIYLFANSEPLFADIKHVDPEHGNYGVRHPKPQGAAEKAPDEYEAMDASEYINQLRELTFTQDQLDGFVKDENANGIPMSAEYDVTVTPGNTGISDFCVFEALIVRACNKITFTYINDRMLGDIVVTDWTLQNTAVTSWLLPRVPANDETNKSLFGAGTKYEGDWIAWYSDHIGSGGHAEELNFEVPEGPDVVPQPFSASYDGSAKVTEPREETVTGLCVPQKKISERAPTPVEDKATYYFLESRCISEETGQQQSYFIGFNTLEYNTTPTTDVDEVQHYWNNKRIYPSGAEAYHLDQVKTLLRDTHVKITATFADMGQVNLDVSILNWKPRDPVEGQLKSE